jgi:hypothetical protein
VAEPDEIDRQRLDSAIHRVEAAIETLRLAQQTLQSAKGRPPPNGTAAPALRDPILVLVVVWPAPVTAQDEYQILARPLTDAYHIPVEPSVVGQHRVGSAQALTIKFRVVPRGSQTEET